VNTTINDCGADRVAVATPPPALWSLRSISGSPAARKLRASRLTLRLLQASCQRPGWSVCSCLVLAARGAGLQCRYHLGHGPLAYKAGHPRQWQNNFDRMAALRVWHLQRCLPDIASKAAAREDRKPPTEKRGSPYSNLLAGPNPSGLLHGGSNRSSPAVSSGRRNEGMSADEPTLRTHHPASTMIGRPHPSFPDGADRKVPGQRPFGRDIRLHPSGQLIGKFS